MIRNRERPRGAERYSLGEGVPSPSPTTPRDTLATTTKNGE